MKLNLNVVCAAILVLGAVGCGRAPEYRPGKKSVSKPGPDSPDGSSPGADSKTMLTCGLEAGKIYKGFGGVDLRAGRAEEIPVEGDRYRIKSYDVLVAEYQRVTGGTPASLTANAPSFGVAPARWYVRTEASAVTLFTSYRVAYEAALKIANADAKYAAVPTADAATANCTTFARIAWNRLPSADEIAGCKAIAMTETAGEPDAKVRWAYALASVLASAGFLAY